MTGFHNIRFPTDISFGSSGGPTFKTQVFVSHRGFEKRNIDWGQPVMNFNVAYGIKTDVQMQNVLEFFNARQGQAFGFRYKNWGNYQVIAESFAVGDGVNTRLPMWKMFGFTDIIQYKRLHKIVEGSVNTVTVNSVAAVEGVDFNIDYNSGEIAFNTITPHGHLIEGNLEYDEPVRFEMDTLQASIDQFNNQSLTGLNLIGVKTNFDTGSIFAPTEDASGADEFSVNTKAILNFDDVAVLTTTIDQSSLAVPVTFNNDATLVTSAFKHGEGSFSTGATGYLTMTGTNYNLATQPFTIEMFIQQPLAGAASQTIIGKWEETATNQCWAVKFVQATKQLQFAISKDGTSEITVLNFPWDTGAPGTFDYISVDRMKNGWYVLRINGKVKQFARDTDVINDVAIPMVIGSLASPAAGQGPFLGLMDSIRITIGRNRYQNFDDVVIPTTYPI